METDRKFFEYPILLMIPYISNAAGISSDKLASIKKLKFVNESDFKYFEQLKYL